LHDMRTSAPPLLPIFRSRLQGDLLARVLTYPSREHSLTELAERIDASVATVQREVERLEQAGILVSRRLGRNRLVTADTHSPVYEPLARLVLVSFGPSLVVAEELAGIAGIEGAYLFGSWAARYEGETGGGPADLDLLIIGSPDRDLVHDAVLRAERRLGMPVNATVRSRRAWEQADEGFIRTVKAGPLVAIPLGPGPGAERG
jgi:DNA-binding transcriptional ArsR family regulator